MANSVEPGSALFCIYHFVKNFGVRNFRTFTVSTIFALSKLCFADFNEFVCVHCHKKIVNPCPAE